LAPRVSRKRNHLIAFGNRLINSLPTQKTRGSGQADFHFTMVADSARQAREK